VAARARYPSAHEQLLGLAVVAREEGLAFAAFWARAVRPSKPPVTWQTPEERRPYGCVVWPRDTTDRNAARAVTDSAEVRSGWMRAYEGWAPTRGDLALQTLAPWLQLVPEEDVERLEARAVTA
jgi:hypothetical protein